MASSRLERIGTIFTSVRMSKVASSTRRNATLKSNMDVDETDDSFLKGTLQRKGPQKNEDEDFSELLSTYESAKKKVKSSCTVSYEETKKKIINAMDHQIVARKQTSSDILENLTDIIKQLEADQEVLKANEQKLECVAGILVKCVKQANVAQKKNLKSLKELQTNFKNQVEGLLTRGAMKPDDRPLWFDVYRAFPPISEPKFAKPKPEIKPIRQILYHEDVIRAKFHSKGQGLGAVNMLNPAGQTHTGKLVKQYEKLKSEGVAVEDLIEKSIAAVDGERQTEAPKLTPKNPESATSQVLADANLKNIFKEEK